MFSRYAFIPLALSALLCSGCGAGRGQASIRSRLVVLPNGSQVTLHTLALQGPVGDAPIDAAIATAQQADTALWSAVAATGSRTKLTWEIHAGLTRDAYAARIRRGQLEEWYRIDLSTRDKADVEDRQLQLFDTISRQIVDGTAAAAEADLRAQVAARIPSVEAAYTALVDAVSEDDALLRVVATYNRGMCAGLAGHDLVGKALLQEAHGYAVRHVPVDIIRQCQTAQQELDALHKQQVLEQVDARARQRP